MLLASGGTFPTYVGYRLLERRLNRLFLRVLGLSSTSEQWNKNHHRDATATGENGTGPIGSREVTVYPVLQLSSIPGRKAAREK